MSRSPKSPFNESGQIKKEVAFDLQPLTRTETQNSINKKKMKMDPSSAILKENELLENDLQEKVVGGSPEAHQRKKINLDLKNINGLDTDTDDATRPVLGGSPMGKRNI